MVKQVKWDRNIETNDIASDGGLRSPGWREDAKQHHDWLRLNHNARGGIIANEHAVKWEGWEKTLRRLHAVLQTHQVFYDLLMAAFLTKQKIGTVQESGEATDRGGANRVKSCLGFK